jgi:triacylglycerol lipase
MKRHLACLVSTLAFAVGCSGAPENSSPASAGSVDSSLSTYTATKNPIVLIPGFLGFKSILGSLDYFSGVPEALAEGGAQAFVVTVAQADSSEVRGQQVIQELEKLRVQTGATRFNLIGHSQGSMDARYIAAVRPDLVASVTGVGGPHKGTPVADFFLTIPLGTELTGGLSDFFKMLAGTPYPNDAKACLTTLSPAGAAAFAVKYPAGVPTTACGEGDPIVNGISYYSWGGTGWLTNPIDLMDPVWALTGPMNLLEPNDGMVGRCSSHLGKVIRDDYLANHIDETNMIFGMVFPMGPNPTTLYRNHANRLKNAGL